MNTPFSDPRSPGALTSSCDLPGALCRRPSAFNRAQTVRASQLPHVHRPLVPESSAADYLTRKTPPCAIPHCRKQSIDRVDSSAKMRRNIRTT